MTNEIIKRVSRAIVETPNASDYHELVAKNAIRAMRDLPHYITPGTVLREDWERAIDKALSDD